MKPYQKVPICDRAEPLVPIPLESFTVVQPHPYVRLGAPYGGDRPTICGKLSAIGCCRHSSSYRHSVQAGTFRFLMPTVRLRCSSS